MRTPRLWSRFFEMPDDRAGMVCRPSPRTAWVFALVCVAVAACSRPAPEGPAAPPVPAAAPALAARSEESREAGPYETPRPTTPREATPLPDLQEADTREPLARAGRQVQRCIDKGRTVYVDLNAICPEGPGVRVTVFPTEGVGAPR
jgi:hypothetical protein